MSVNMTDNGDEIRDAELLRSLDIIIDSWENDDLSIDDMADQLEAATKIVDGSSSLSEFVEETNLHDREQLH